MKPDRVSPRNGRDIASGRAYDTRMGETVPALVLLALLCWSSLAVLVALFLRLALRDDAGYGAAGRGRLRRPLPPRPALTPVAVGRRQFSGWRHHRA